MKENIQACFIASIMKGLPSGSYKVRMANKLMNLRKNHHNLK